MDERDSLLGYLYG